MKQTVKVIIDILLTVVLLLLMSYSLIGEELHEWIGAAMFLLFIIHHILNRKWHRNLFKGKYTPIRIFQVVLVVCVFICMIGSVVSGMLLSRYVFGFLPIHGGRALGRTLHMLSAYWGFVFMSLHLGFHWRIMVGMAKKLMKTSFACTWVLRMAAALFAGYGIYAFIHREVGSYMLLKNQYVFFDFGEPYFLFIADYMGIMGLFVFVGYYISQGLNGQIFRR